MRRRDFITLLAGAAAWPVVARAQQEKTFALIGLLSPFSPAAAASWHEAFRQGLRDLGWIEGKNIHVEYRYAEGRIDVLPDLAAALVRLNPDVIVVSISTDALVAQKVTRNIPLVVASAGDPVASGLAESLARPGGNITGLSQIAPELAGKRLEVLKEMVPTLSRVAVLWNPSDPSSSSTLSWHEIQPPARQLGLILHSLEVQSPDQFDKAFEKASRENTGALVITPDPLFAGNVKQLADLAIRIRLPSVFHLKEFVESGGLISYGIDRSDQFRRAAAYVDKILKGAKPADLPIEQASKFELAININTAKALGLEVPATVLARADVVIE
jgi:putative tryptophan/tyrosine transport system substrate-binding protein